MTGIHRSKAFCAELVIVGCLLTTAAFAQRGAADGEWPVLGGDKANTKYSPLEGINAGTIKDLSVAWRWESPDNAIFKDNPSKVPNRHKSAPLVANGVMYSSTSYGMAAAIDPKTGETLWVFDPEIWKERRPGNLGWNHKGLAYWTDGQDEERIILGTNTAYMYSIDAKTGKPDPNFGENGRVDLVENYRRRVLRHNVYLNAPLLVTGDLIIETSSLNDRPTLKEMVPGDVRAFDIRSGELRWTFHNPPMKGEFGYDTWETGSADYTGNTNVWTYTSVDEELGLLYLPFGTPTNDFYGGHRPGKGLFAESLVCVEVNTGKLVWYFQSTHHGLWDWDLPAAPALVDIAVDGRAIKALAQVTKQGFLWVLDRTNGEPVWPVEERPVPQTTVEGEKTWPTQPFPTKPAPYTYQGSMPDLLIDFTPELHAKALEILKEYNYGPIYTPPLTESSGKMTIVMPGWGGGANWGGASFDPDTNVYYVPSNNARASTYMLAKPDAARSNFDYVATLGRGPQGPEGLPLWKPPYAHVTAISLNTGEHLWEIPIGDGPRDHPLLKDLNLPPMGDLGSIYPLLTKSFLFIAGGGGKGKPNFRAIDKATGKTVWETELASTPGGNPITYEIDGKQYISIPAGGRRDPAEIITLSTTFDS